MLKPHIYIPIEIAPRELDSKILFSISAVKKGYRVYIGSKDSIEKLLIEKKSNQQKGGVFFYKSQFINQLQHWSNLISQSCDKFVVLDEELGPVVKDINSVINLRLKNLYNINQYYIIGDQFYKDIIKKKKKFKRIFYKTGWPRIDLWCQKNSNLYQNKVKEIKKKHGDFILFSSDFGAVSKKGLKIHLKNFKKNQNLKPWVNTLKKSYDDYLEFKDLIKVVSKNLNKNIIIRPHPSDLFHSDWYKEFKNEKKIKIIYDDDISPWILASSCLLHRGCTTAVQAYFYGKSIYYWKSRNKLEKKDETLSYLISDKINKIDDFKKLMFRNKNKISNINKQKLINKKIVISNRETACSKIIKNLKKLKVTREEAFKKNMFDYYKSLFLNEIFRFLIKLKIKQDNFSKTYIQKHPYRINSKIIKKKTSLLSSNYKFKIKDIKMNLVEIDR